MSNEVRFPKGLIVKRPHQNAPDFVKAKLSIKKDELIEWLKSESGEWVNLDLKTSKENKLYLSVDDWKPDNQNSGSEMPPEPEEGSDLPF